MARGTEWRRSLVDNVKSYCHCCLLGFDALLSCTRMLWLFMSMWCGYIPKLGPPTSPLFNLQVMYDYGEPRWNYNDRGTEELGKKLTPVLTCPRQIPHELTRARSRVFALRRQRLTFWAMTWPTLYVVICVRRYGSNHPQEEDSKRLNHCGDLKFH
jgi:hypothetical protein